MKYKIHINSSNYKDWILYDQETMVPIKNAELIIDPITKKLFNCDILDDGYNIVHSTIRLELNIPGIILLVGKTYGRKNNTNKFYYKCIPNDKRLPAFLVPYEPKNIGFNKNITNRYILFKYNAWTNKHPIGTITNTIGNISDLGCFYEYQLYCKNLVISLKEFINAANSALKREAKTPFISNIMESNKMIENRLDYDIITIDPNLCTDIDDGMGIKDNILSVYIANVPILMEYLQLWNSFSERISTIYLPDRKCPMLPALLSENLCSLLESESRFAFSMDIEIVDNDIKSISFSSTLISVRKNYVYEADELIKDENYMKILNITQILCKKYKYIKEINDSHDVVTFLMILMNSECAKLMCKFKDGIYRTLKLKESTNDNDNKNNDSNSSVESNNIENTSKLSNEIHSFIKIWQSSSGQYATFENRDSHDLIGIGLENYLHITSPIRRLVDLLNIIKIQSNLNLIEMKSDITVFYDTWVDKLEYINTTMRSIRKVQNDCNTLSMCTNNPELLSAIYDGYVFDKIDWGNLYYQYTVYIPKIKLVSRINIKDELKDYSCWKFRLYLIEDGITLKRKIRIEIEK